MPSLAQRYAAGEHEAVWREINAQDLPLMEQYALSRSAPSDAEIEDVMRQTFERVARNVDKLVERLPEYGYRFECEAGRYGEPTPPRRPAQLPCRRARKAVEAALQDESEFDAPWPAALSIFAEIVGSVDLRQRGEEPLSGFEPEQEQARNVLTDPAFLSGVPKQTAEFLKGVVTRNDGFLAKQRTRDIPDDPGPHPFADEPVIPSLGDWDPLEVNFDYLAADLSENAAFLPLKDGGAAIIGEFGASFEHKANVSGAENPWFAFPANRTDPIVRAEGIYMPFSTYLRRIFERGGFFGTPRPMTGADEIDLIEVEPGIFLPDHPVFSTLAADLEPI